jgi:hypothetical protein
MSKIKFLFHIISFSFIKPDISKPGGKGIDNKTGERFYRVKFSVSVLTLKLFSVYFFESNSAITSIYQAQASGFYNLFGLAESNNSEVYNQNTG